jgi:hypothetical protein
MVHVYVGALLFSHCSDALRLADAHMFLQIRRSRNMVGMNMGFK